MRELAAELKPLRMHGAAGITRHGRRVPFYSTVDRVHALKQKQKQKQKQDRAQGKARRIAAVRRASFFQRQHGICGPYAACETGKIPNGSMRYHVVQEMNLRE